MLNKTATTRNRSRSMFPAKSQKPALPQKYQTPVSLAFINQNYGKVFCSTTEFGTKRLDFSSDSTGRTAFAYGDTFFTAFANLVSNFNQKYL